MREPENEMEVNAVLWKLEALGALPFAHFRTLAYPGVSSGPDLFVDFQEDKVSEFTHAAVVEVERNFDLIQASRTLACSIPQGDLLGCACERSKDPF